MADTKHKWSKQDDLIALYVFKYGNLTISPLSHYAKLSLKTFSDFNHLSKTKLKKLAFAKWNGETPSIEEISRNQGMSVRSLRMRVQNFKYISENLR